MIGQVPTTARELDASAAAQEKRTFEVGRSRAASAARRLVLLLAVCMVAACGGGGGGGSPTSPPPPPPPPPPGATVTSDVAASANTVSLRAGTGASGQLSLEVVATDIPDVYGLSFDLSYPTSLLRFVEGSEGEFLSGSGAVDTSLQVFQSNGQLIIGHSRLGSEGGTSGTGVVLRLVFDTIGTGDGRLTFTNTSGVDANGEVLRFLGWIDAGLRVD